VVIDSVSYACVGEEVEKSVTATKYSMAVNQLEKPVLSIAHVTKADLDPNHPFGSIFWSNGARVTIAVSRKVAEDAESDRIVRNPKTNQRGPFPTVAIKWDWLGQTGAPGCADRDKAHGHPKWNDLHESRMVKTFSAAAKLVIPGLRQKYGRDPTTDEVIGAVETEYPGTDVPKSVVQQVSKLNNELRPMNVNRVAPASGNDIPARV